MKVIIGVIGLCAVLTACGGVKNAGSAASSSSAAAAPTVNGNGITGVDGKTLLFRNDTGIALGDVSSVSVQGNSIYIGLYNSASGRRATVRVDTDYKGEFASVNAQGKPYMCLNPALDICAKVMVPQGFDFAGTSQPNCASPIYFDGPLVGSVNNLMAPAHVSCPQ